MSEIALGERRLRCADLGVAGPLPPVGRNLDGTGYGRVRNVFPYLPQDGYGRVRQLAGVPMAVCENAHLRAEFAIGLGGRLWSLTHKPTGRDLLYTNPVFQPANLALRNAWFAGGVEWNIGTRGHSPTTCAPLNAAVAPGSDGRQVLRMWEWERLRDVLFQIDAWLDEEAPVLYVHVRIRNPNDHAVPMYWWSNAAVPERPWLRVLTPARRAFRSVYDGTLGVVPTANAPWSYPAVSEHAADFFYELEPTQRPWIAALDSDGHGLVQTSTARLRGRKLFVWGQSRGGRHWAEWLTEPGAGAYAEIQAGLATTQHEHVHMPAGAEWRWLEAYAPLTADPATSHGADWDAAVGHIKERLPEIVPAFALDDQYHEAAAHLDAPPLEHLAAGGGLGALEVARRTADGDPAVDLTGTPLPVVDGPEYRPWATLLATGALPDADPAEPPTSYVHGPGWERRLLDAPPGWLPSYHLATTAHARGDLRSARSRYHESLRFARSAWALRGLGLLEAEEGRADRAADLLAAAHEHAPEVWQLTVEAVLTLVEAGLASDALALVDALPDRQRECGRVRLAEVRAALGAGDPGRARDLLRGGIEVPDLAEGELSLAELWAAACSGEPLPDEYDFAMTSSG